MTLKGIHDIATAQTLISHSMPASRSGIVRQLARMEQERAQLTGQLDVWLGQTKRTKARLQKVQQHIEMLRQTLDELPATDGGEDSRSPGMARDEGEAEGWCVIQLEY